jgi:hypothetical protein
MSVEKFVIMGFIGGDVYQKITELERLFCQNQEDMARAPFPCYFNPARIVLRKLTYANG